MKINQIAQFTLKTVVVASATCLFSSMAFANMMSDYRQRLSQYTLDCAHWYVGGDVGLSYVRDKRTNSSSLPMSSVRKFGPGATVYGGYRFNSLFGWELGFTQYHKSRETRSRVSGGGSLMYPDVEHYAIDTAATGHLPLVDKFSAIGKLGVAYNYANKEFPYFGLTWSAASVSAYAGLGATYSVSKTTELVAEWTCSRGNNYTGSTQLYSLGVTVALV